MDLKSIRAARLVIALNDTIREHCIAYGVEPSKIWKRTNPVDKLAFYPPSQGERQRAREKVRLARSDVGHLVLARFHPRKNQLLAVEALTRLPENHKLILAGPVFPTEKAYFGELKTAIERYSLTGRVRLIPQNIQSTLLLYHAADCCWLPSTREGLPNVMLEAFCCGVPVIVNEALDLGEYVRDGINGYNVTCAPSVFANAAMRMMSIVNNFEARLTIAAEAQRRFDAERLNGEFADRLAEILDLANDGRLDATDFRGKEAT